MGRVLLTRGRTDRNQSCLASQYLSNQLLVQQNIRYIISLTGEANVKDCDSRETIGHQLECIEMQKAFPILAYSCDLLTTRELKKNAGQFGFFLQLEPCFYMFCIVPVNYILCLPTQLLRPCDAANTAPIASK